jgi:hypothetical protein
MTGFYAWAALAALGFVAVVTLISRPEQMWANTSDLLGSRIVVYCRQDVRAKSLARSFAHDPYFWNRRSGSSETIGSLAVVSRPLLTDGDC